MLWVLCIYKGTMKDILTHERVMRVFIPAIPLLYTVPCFAGQLLGGKGK